MLITTKNHPTTACALKTNSFLFTAFAPCEQYKRLCAWDFPRDYSEEYVYRMILFLATFSSKKLSYCDMHVKSSERRWTVEMLHGENVPRQAATVFCMSGKGG